MGFAVKILADSINPCGNRLTTWELTYPRFIHAEFMTHREFSRNSASSRAIPVAKMIQHVKDDPVIPIHWGRAQPGMQAYEELEHDVQAACDSIWLTARDNAIDHVQELLKLGLHKQIANRLLEPWMWITVIASTTNMQHFLSLRDHPAAEPHFQKLARMMRQQYELSEPYQLEPCQWHMPLILPEEYSAALNIGDVGQVVAEMAWFLKVSVGRCARVSYLTHDGYRDQKADVELHDKLVSAVPGHWSPTEHVAQCLDKPERHGNFTGWLQYRKTFATEYVAC